MSKKEDQLVAKVKSLLHQNSVNYLKIGQYLSELNSMGYYVKNLCEEVDLGIRKAYMLIDAYSVVEQYGIDPELAIHIGWTKMARIKPHIRTEDDAKKWTVAASTMSCSKLEMALAGAGADMAEEVQSVVIHMTRHEATLFNHALRRNGAVGYGNGLQRRNKALFAILAKAGELDIAVSDILEDAA